MKLLATAILSIAIPSLHAEDAPTEKGDAQKPTAQQDETFKIFLDPSGKEYFPKDQASYFKEYLSAMAEPSVKADLEKGVERVFRLTILPSFDDPIAIRFVDTGENLTVRAVRLKMDMQYHPEKIVSDKTWKLDDEAKKATQELLAQKDFWKPLSPTEEALAQGGLDGARWLFELHDKDGYRMIDVWSPAALAEMGAEGVRDFLVYQKTGAKVLEIGKISPKAEDGH